VRRIAAADRRAGRGAAKAHGSNSWYTPVEECEMSSRSCVALLFCLTAFTAPLSAAQSDASVVQIFYDNVCAFAKSRDSLSEYTFLAKYLADSLTATMISGKPYGKSTALAELKSHDVPVKPASCFTEVSNVTRNGDQVTAEVTLHGLSGDSSGSIQSVDRYEVVFVNTPPWQLLKSSQLERWELDGNGKVLAHAVLPATTPGALHALRLTWFPMNPGHLTLSIPTDVFERQGYVRPRFSEFSFYDAASDAPLLNLAEGDGSYDFKSFTKTCLHGRVARSAGGGDSGTVIMGMPGSWVVLWWSDLSGDRLNKARTIVSSMNLDFGPTC
jgi:hypothetical protein